MPQSIFKTYLLADHKHIHMYTSWYIHHHILLTWFYLKFAQWLHLEQVNHSCSVMQVRCILASGRLHQSWRIIRSICHSLFCRCRACPRMSSLTSCLSLARSELCNRQTSFAFRWASIGCTRWSRNLRRWESYGRHLPFWRRWFMFPIGLLIISERPAFRPLRTFFWWKWGFHCFWEQISNAAPTGIASQIQMVIQYPHPEE